MQGGHARTRKQSKSVRVCRLWLGCNDRRRATGAAAMPALPTATMVRHIRRKAPGHARGCPSPLVRVCRCLALLGTLVLMSLCMEICAAKLCCSRADSLGHNAPRLVCRDHHLLSIALKLIHSLHIGGHVQARGTVVLSSRSHVCGHVLSRSC